MAVHSYSSLKDFKDCEKKYHEVRVLKKYPFVKTVESEFGDRAHKALELCGRDGIPLPEEFKAYQWAIDDLVRKLPGQVYFEHEFSLSRTGSKVPPRDWNNKFWMGKADVLAIDGKVAYVIDWKTGKSKYPDPAQIDTMAMFTFMDFPAVEEVRGLLVFLQDAVTETKIITRAEIPRLSQMHYGAVKDIEFAQESGRWVMKPTGLCPWCPVTDCPNWKPKPEGK